MAEQDRAREIDSIAELLHQAEVSVVPGPVDPPVGSPHFDKVEAERYRRMAQAVVNYGNQRREEALREAAAVVYTHTRYRADTRETDLVLEKARTAILARIDQPQEDSR